ncbi:phosphate ABC transporter substrate-binding protein [Vibrio fluvialis]|uniref:phosphate ABC transporter substrate-binding protein n=1 Tax=Vibrio fluvialis TaxID=676 RepID=UPI001558ED87|nr:phosphate ABC transporter substrate-binding protein [Vibrio fluvialis]EKO3916156.1 phosphate ABC transporter substrate-binding protein [Vibrio fluvialis]EKO5123303.1 phosphate ABC transporter substrate-binding protein [Vibrio fluvialis]ELL4666371.1 phosphate ABC transporter substrate-binding protein [Vibrio fluvialis]ELO4021021.1 phosphate ABC transporter substrate-binding protein [Vibrio fluvialis]MBY7766228.1 phosphate ABC transporter substrate-binding protein [Vibrio fluvialis]
MLRVALAALCSLSLLTSFAQASEINVSGSTSVARIMDVLAEEYNATHPDSYIAVQGVGSTAGITLLKKGVAHIAMSSRYLTESEEEDSLNTFLLAYDGLAVVVNRANPVSDLSREQLYNIYKGKINNWKQVGGNDQKIAVVTREASSGTRYSFESLLGLTKIINDRLVSDINPNNLVVNSNSMVKTLVNHNSQAIGFISTGSVDKSVKAIKFEGIDATSKTIADHKYALSRPFLILHYTDKDSKEAKAFLDFLRSERAKALIVEYGYIPVGEYK